MFQSVQSTPSARDTDCQKGVKQSSFLWGAAQGGGGEEETPPRPELCPSLTWKPNTESSARRFIFSFKHPLFFYNPLLLSLSLCVVLKELRASSSPPSVVKCRWSPAQQPVSPLLTPSRGMGGQEDRRLSGFSLSAMSLPKLVVFFCVPFYTSLTGK